MSNQNTFLGNDGTAPTQKLLVSLQDWAYNQVIGEISRIEGMESIVKMLTGMSIINFYLNDPAAKQEREMDKIVSETIVGMLNTMADMNAIPS